MKMAEHLNVANEWASGRESGCTLMARCMASIDDTIYPWTSNRKRFSRCQDPLGRGIFFPVVIEEKEKTLPQNGENGPTERMVFEVIKIAGYAPTREISRCFACKIWLRSKRDKSDLQKNEQREPLNDLCQPTCDKLIMGKKFRLFHDLNYFYLC